MEISIYIKANITASRQKTWCFFTNEKNPKKTIKKIIVNNQHADFPSGLPPEYYLHLSVLNFAERTGCGVLTLIWPIMHISSFITLSLPTHTVLFLLYTKIQKKLTRQNKAEVYFQKKRKKAFLTKAD